MPFVTQGGAWDSTGFSGKTESLNHGKILKRGHMIPDYETDEELLAGRTCEGPLDSHSDRSQTETAIEIVAARTLLPSLQVLPGLARDSKRRSPQTSIRSITAWFSPFPLNAQSFFLRYCRISNKNLLAPFMRICYSRGPRYAPARTQVRLLPPSPHRPGSRRA